MDILINLSVHYPAMQIWSKHVREKLKDIDEFLLEQYKQSREEKKRDWRTYEEQYALRIKEAMKELAPLINEAVDSIRIEKGRGRQHGLTLKQRVTLLLLQRLFGESNRMMASMLAIFSALSGIDVSYKTVERLYSDPEVELALHNLHVLILRKKGVDDIEASGDGTGYSLTIKKNYASETEKRNDEVKETKNDRKMSFAYSFKLMDIKTKMYVAYGTSLKSEREAYARARLMLKGVGIHLNSISLDRYYSHPLDVDSFGKTKVYIIPRKDAILKGSWKWKRTMFEFVEETLSYLGHYYQRESSENGWSVDKRRFGWDIAQRREDRIDRADFCTTVWHNLFQLGGD
jgi:transposase